MLSDPQSVTLNAVAVTLPRTSVGDNTATYTKDDGTVALKVQHTQTRGKKKTMIRLDTLDIAADPLLAGINREARTAVWLVIDRPTVGVSQSAQLDKAKALLGALSASSYALLTKVIGGES